MGFWGKAIGATLGLMVGGPLGAIIGAVIGHGFDAERQWLSRREVQCPNCHNPVVLEEDTRNWICPHCHHEIGYNEIGNEYDRQFIFYVSLASLAAKMAKADGVVTSDEVRAFDRFVTADLNLNTREKKIVAQLFNEAKKSTDDGLMFAGQFYELMGHRPDVLQIMIQLLFRISMADGHFHPAEERFISQIAGLFRLTNAEYEQIKALYVKKNDRAYQLLGVTANADDEQVKKAYKKLVQEYHPDKLSAKGVPEDFIKFANEKMAEINNAYSTIRKERGI
jgi:DnaJ like chaperone protein